MKRVLLLSIFLSLFLTANAVQAQSDAPLIIKGNQTYVIEDSKHVLNGFNVTDNSTLTIRNSEVTMLESSYTVTGSGVLIIENSTLGWQGQGGVRLKDESRSEIVNSTIFMEYEVANRTYYGHGFGLSEKSSIKIEDTKIEYLKLSDWASCFVNRSTVGEFGSTSYSQSEVEKSKIQSLILTYEDTWIRINETLSGKVTWTSDQIVENGNYTYPVSLTETEIVSPPSFQLMNCNLEANNTEMDLVLIGGNSGVTLNGVDITLLYLVEDVWATVIGSELDILRCRNGDFNVKVTGSDVEILETMMTTGFNLRVIDSSLGPFNLMYAHPEAPNNVEVLDSEIGILYLTPSSPPIYMFDGVEVCEEIILESDEAISSAPLITGKMSFGANCNVTHDEREGETEVIRVFRVEAYSDNETASNLPYTVMNGNNTIKTGTSSESGVIVFPLKFRRECGLIQNPQPGGPYLKDLNNFTAPLMLMIGNQATVFGFTSDTPVTVQLTADDTPVPTTETSTPVTPGTALVLALMALGGMTFIIQKGKTAPSMKSN